MLKRGRKPNPNKKKRTTVTLDQSLVTEVEKRTENLSGFLNEAGKAYLPKWDRNPKTEGKL